MSANVVSLVPNKALCADVSEIAARLREMADRIEADEFGSVERVVVVVDSGPVDYRCYGRPTDNGALVGLLEWAKAKAMGLIG